MRLFRFQTLRSGMVLARICWTSIEDPLEAKMIPLTLIDMQILISVTVFVLGCMSIILGGFVLISRGYSREVRTLAVSTARLSQKGMTEEISGLVSSASDLVNAINDLVKTASGIGVFLVVLGLGMVAASYWIILQIDWTLV